MIFPSVLNWALLCSESRVHPSQGPQVIWACPCSGLGDQLSLCYRRISHTSLSSLHNSDKVLLPVGPLHSCSHIEHLALPVGACGTRATGSEVEAAVTASARLWLSSRLEHLPACCWPAGIPPLNKSADPMSVWWGFCYRAGLLQILQHHSWPSLILQNVHWPQSLGFKLLFSFWSSPLKDIDLCLTKYGFSIA